MPGAWQCSVMLIIALASSLQVVSADLSSTQGTGEMKAKWKCGKQLWEAFTGLHCQNRQHGSPEIESKRRDCGHAQGDQPCLNLPCYERCNAQGCRYDDLRTL